jgi:hypothetical protein
MASSDLRSERLKVVSKPTSRNGMSHRSKRVLCLVGVVTVLAALTLGLAALCPSPYRRFVSAPLTDGTRYTFLYPRSLGTPDTDLNTLPDYGGGDSECPCVQLRESAGPAEKLVGLLSHEYLARDIMVVVRGSKTIPLTAASGWRVTARDGRYIRSEKTDPDLFMGAYYVSVLDSRTSTSCDFEYQYYGYDSNRRRFHLDREDAMVLESFRVLPPGAPVSSP